ncbi:hypothetical protein [Phenylobacterium sp.]|uniref:hypothetical protein n=1 Tax=Phenylobacterium sp. TaxID=1871053 RepID=UPI00356184DE
MVRALWLGLVGLVWMLASPAAAKPDLFSDEAPLEMTITAPFPTLVHAAKTSTNPFPASLSVSDGAGPAKTFAVELRARGLTRRTGGYCQFPPLSLTFDKAAVKGTLFHGQHKLKLVTYCNTPADQEQRIVLEYLVYRLYNLVTPMSYRVRAAQVSYRTGDKDAGLKRFGYLIEDIDDVAERNHRDRIKTTSHQLTAAQFDPRAAGRAAMLEYMIGNLDWDFLAGPAGDECCHNSRFLAAKGATPATAAGVTPVPYDFDYSGFVDAPYALPPEKLKVASVRERLYRGYCVSTGEIPAVIADFRSHRAEMTALINGYPSLNPKFRAKTTAYLDSFFAVLDDPARVDASIVKRCR